MSDGTFGAKNIGLTLEVRGHFWSYFRLNLNVRGHFRSYFRLNLNVRGHFRSYFRHNLNVRVTLSELGAWKSFLNFFFLVEFFLGSSRPSADRTTRKTQQEKRNSKNSSGARWMELGRVWDYFEVGGF